MDFGKCLNVLNSLSLNTIMNTLKKGSREEAVIPHRLPSITEQVEKFRQDLIVKKKEKNTSDSGRSVAKLSCYSYTLTKLDTKLRVA